jgi:hypothetical protein
VKSIIIKEGVEAFVDDEDYEYLSQMKWSQQVGYAVSGSKIKGIYECAGNVLMHRLVINAKKGQIVDHIDRNKLNNTKENLRFVSFHQNAHNRPKRKNTKSEFKGVVPKKRGNYVFYDAICNIYGRNFLGTYNTEIAAAYAYNKKALELSPDYALLNKFDLSIEELEKKIIDELIVPIKSEKQSKQKGVVWCKSRQMWRARKQGIKCKEFKEEIDAINYYKKFLS